MPLDNHIKIEKKVKKLKKELEALTNARKRLNIQKENKQSTRNNPNFRETGYKTIKKLFLLAPKELSLLVTYQIEDEPSTNIFVIDRFASIWNHEKYLKEEKEKIFQSLIDNKILNIHQAITLLQKMQERIIKKYTTAHANFLKSLEKLTPNAPLPSMIEQCEQFVDHPCFPITDNNTLITPLINQNSEPFNISEETSEFINDTSAIGILYEDIQSIISSANLIENDSSEISNNFNGKFLTENEIFTTNSLFDFSFSEKTLSTPTLLSENVSEIPTTFDNVLPEVSNTASQINNTLDERTASIANTADSETKSSDAKRKNTSDEKSSLRKKNKIIQPKEFDSHQNNPKLML